jgi:membrane-associated phospholipid phosphatase
MIHWLQSLDIGLFRFINQALINPVFDVVMPLASENVLFRPLVLVAAILFIWKGRLRGIVCVSMLVVILAFGDGFVCNTIKHAVARPRPYAALAGVHRPGTSPSAPPMSPTPLSATEKSAPHYYPPGSRTSMPSSHAANWFAATMILFIYYRRSLWFMLPAALVVSFSRIYNGMHYPSDVLAGAILGAGYAAGGVWSLDALWRWGGQKWFPLWWSKMPSLLQPECSLGASTQPEGTFPLTPSPSPGKRAPRLTGRDNLLNREPLPARPTVPPLPQGEGRGEGESAARFPQPGLARPAGTAPLPAPGTPHASVDQHWLRLGYIWIALNLLIGLIYIASNAIQLAEDESYQWIWSKHLALSYYSKPPLIAYTQFLGTALWGDTAFGVRFFAPVIAAIIGLLVLRFFARVVNARAGFFLLLIVGATPLLAVGGVLMTVDPLSVLFWVAAMLTGWRAVQDNGRTRDWLWVGLWLGLGFLSKYTELFQLLCLAVFFVLWKPARKHLRRPGPYLALLLNVVCALPVLIWNAQHGWITVTHVAQDGGMGTPWRPTLKYLGDFLASETGLLNPVFFVATLWAAIAFWRRGRHDPRLVYFFSMGAPLFLAYLAQTGRSRVLPNWIAPSVVPLFCFMVIYWDTRWRLGAARIKPWLISGLTLGFALVVVCHNTDLLPRLTGWRLPVNADPLHRVRGWSDVARVVGDARQDLLKEGKPVFIIAGHYGLVGEISFYLPEAKAAVTKDPLVFYRHSPVPDTQFYFWPGYENRKGQNAIYVRELDRDRKSDPPEPPFLAKEFDSVTLLGVSNVLYHGRVLWPLQLYACRGLR